MDTPKEPLPLPASDLFALIRELRADYGRLRLMDSALSLCGGRVGATHAALREKVLLAQKKIGMPNWRYLELCPKCKGCGQVYAAYSLDSAPCGCHDGYVMEANNKAEAPSLSEVDPPAAG